MSSTGRQKTVSQEHHRRGSFTRWPSKKLKKKSSSGDIIFFIAFKERGKGWGRKNRKRARGRERRRLVASHMHPDQQSNPQPLVHRTTPNQPSHTSRGLRTLSVGVNKTTQQSQSKVKWAVWKTKEGWISEWVRWQKNKDRNNSNISPRILNIYIKLSSNNSEPLLLWRQGC